MNQKEFLSGLENQLHLQMDFVVKHFQNMPTEKLCFQPCDKEWSISQCIDHLNTYSEYYLPLLKGILDKRDKQAASSKDYKPGLLGNFLNKKIHPQTGFKKMKAHPSHLPTSKADPSSIIALHLQYQETLLQYLRDFQSVNINRHKIPVSILKLLKLSSGDILQFMIYHQQRHLDQAERIRSKFPLEK